MRENIEEKIKNIIKDRMKERPLLKEKTIMNYYMDEKKYDQPEETAITMSILMEKMKFMEKEREKEMERESEKIKFMEKEIEKLKKENKWLKFQIFELQHENFEKLKSKLEEVINELQDPQLKYEEIKRLLNFKANEVNLSRAQFVKFKNEINQLKLQVRNNKNERTLREEQISILKSKLVCL